MAAAEGGADGVDRVAVARIDLDVDDRAQPGQVGGAVGPALAVVLGDEDRAAVGDVDRVRVVGVGALVGDLEEVRVEDEGALGVGDGEVLDGDRRWRLIQVPCAVLGLHDAVAADQDPRVLTSSTVRAVGLPMARTVDQEMPPLVDFRRTALVPVRSETA